MASTDPASEVVAYEFTSTQDWFSHNIQHWSSLFPLVTSSHPRVLEIGSWEGRSAVFLLNNLCKNGGEIMCIDHFDLFHTEAGRQRFNRINRNLLLAGKKSRVLSQFSVPALMIILEEEMSSSNPGFDWIYIDGSHEADDTMLDGELAWRLARKGAIVIFDDYNWDKEPVDSIHHPKRGIDTFLTLHAGQYERLTEDSHYQVVLRKLTEMRIGFLVADKAEHGMNDALDYGIHVALIVDSVYAMGAAIAIRSVADTTPGRITFYVVDCGLTASEKVKLQETISFRTDTTMVFRDLPTNCLASQLGAVWAKLDMIDILPVERVLYLDADVLVRSSVRKLWDTDLMGKSLAAAPDVGHPTGHGSIESRPYFNAGVLLLDLARIRLRCVELKKLSRSMKNAKFREQDVLNKHFSEDWVALDLKWNAQGLGTYAKYPSPDRDALQLASMQDPSIVHFTGPVHPSVAEVLNPYIQPVTAKPWGYMGAPGHPFQHDWWHVLEKTPWKGIRSTATWYHKICDKKKSSCEPPM
ncbi:glycosyltransferase family 8 protein [Crucibulum laeve]|uniref:Glycosyltransferase family 8 protein n=1 Tax=Crucibulum laeve TaxID=68775 RepID=A0A5C3LUB2_9AGAR|nr:glycosyltransferase family 8 protein [Crucibulum laeve]